MAEPTGALTIDLSVPDLSIKLEVFYSQTIDGVEKG